MYHNVVPACASSGHDEQSITMREADFVRQVKNLKRIFEFVSLEKYIEEWHINGKQPLTKAVLTIDDGTWSTFEYGVMHLVEMRIPSLLFVNTCQIDDGPLIWGAYLNALCFDTTYEVIEVEGKSFPIDRRKTRHESRRALVKLARSSDHPNEMVLKWTEQYPIPIKTLKYYQGLTTNQLKAAGKSSLVEIGVHTHNHPFLSSLTKAQQREEIKLNRNILESKTQRIVRYMAYPSGDYNSDTMELMKELDFRASCAVHMDGQSKNLIYKLPRVGIYKSSTFRVLASAVKNRLKLKRLRFEK